MLKDCFEDIRLYLYEEGKDIPGNFFPNFFNFGDCNLVLILKPIVAMCSYCNLLSELVNNLLCPLLIEDDLYVENS